MATRPQEQGGASAPSNVTPIRRRVKVPKVNRPEDQEAITHQRITAMMQRGADKYFGTEHHASDGHVQLQCMAWRAERTLPKNHLRLFVRPDDPAVAIFRANREMEICDLEWRLADAKRLRAFHAGDKAEVALWDDRREEARIAREDAFERLVRTRAPSLWLHALKICRAWGTYGDRKYLRKYVPEIAAVLDEEHARLIAEKEAQKAERAAKKQGRA